MANQAIRQEINISDIVTTSGAGNEIVLLDTTQYSGSVTYYFEVASITGSVSLGTSNFRLRRVGTTTDDATITNTTPNTLELQRTSFTPPVGQTEYFLFANHDGTNTPTCYISRIIVLQNEATITQTQTQIEIGQADSSRTNSTVADMTNPKYWKYNSADWDSTKAFSVEVIWRTSAKNTATITLCRTSDNATNVTIVNAGTNSTGYIRTRVSFTPVNGETYKIRCLGSTTKSNYSIAGAKIIVDQNATPTESQEVDNVGEQVFGGLSVGTNEQLGQSWTAGSSYSISIISLKLARTASPTDNLTLEILTGSMTGTVIGTSGSISPTYISGSSPYNWVPFTFSSPVSITNGTKYYLRLSRDGARDITNYWIWRLSTGSSMANGGDFRRNTGTWTSESATDDFAFRIYTSTTAPIYKLESQYLLLNRTLGGSGNSNALTKWVSSEWNAGAGTLTYKHAMDANNAANSSKLQNASNADVTSSTVTGTAQQVSSAITLVNNTTYHTNVITDTGGTISASRILVTYVYSIPISRRIFITGG